MVSIFVSSTAVHIYDFHIFTVIIHHMESSFEPTRLPAPSWLVSSFGKALHRYRKGHGLKSRTGLNFFRPYFNNYFIIVHNSQNCFYVHFFNRSVHNDMIFIHFQLLFTTWKVCLKQNDDQLSVGLLAQLVERCTSIAEVMGSNPVRAWIFFRPYFNYYFSSVHNCDDRFCIRKMDSRPHIVYIFERHTCKYVRNFTHAVSAQFCIYRLISAIRKKSHVFSQQLLPFFLSKQLEFWPILSFPLASPRALTQNRNMR